MDQTQFKQTSIYIFKNEGNKRMSNQNQIIIRKQKNKIKYKIKLYNWVNIQNKQNKMQVQYASQISSDTINHILQNTQNIIKIKQLCKNQLPSKCTQQAHSFLYQNFNNLINSNLSKPYVQNQTQYIYNIQNDNRTPMKLKISKNMFTSQLLSQRLSFDTKSFRKSSAFKSKRDQRTASRELRTVSRDQRNINRQQRTASTSHRERKKEYSKSYNKQFLQQQRPWTQTQCRKRMSKTSHSSSKNKYFELKDEKSINIQDEIKRKQLKQRLLKQRQQNDKIQHALMKLSYQRRQLQQQLQSAKIADKRNPLNKNNKLNQIVSYQTQNGSLLTNKFKKPFRKTIQNIINIQYQQKTQNRILKRKSQRQYQITNHNQKADDQQNIINKFIQNNQHYSNSGKRQISLIPYVTINPGVSLSQSTIQASISRARPSDQLSRQKYFTNIENKTFRSYSKQTSPSKMDNKFMTIDICQKHRGSKSTLNNETKDSLRKSILWGPKTSRDSHRIKLQKQDLLKQLTD